MDVVALRIEPERLAQLTRGLDAHVELVANDDGCYRCVVVPIESPSSTRRSDTSGASADGRRKNFSTLAEQRADERARTLAAERKRGVPVDLDNLPVIRWVKFANKCAHCRTVVPRGASARWNPETKDVFCNECEPLPNVGVVA